MTHHAATFNFNNIFLYTGCISMDVKFWGVRGSLPSTNHQNDVKWKLRRILEAAPSEGCPDDEAFEAFFKTLPYYLLNPVGDNTSCVEIKSGDHRLILDGGSGLKPLGQELADSISSDQDDLSILLENGWLSAGEMEPEAKEPGLEMNMLFSHFHWDHVQGFPFFTPAYVPQNKLHLYAKNGQALAEVLETQQRAPVLFPIGLKSMGSEITFHSLPDVEFSLGPFRITAHPLPHPGGCQSFKIKADGRTVIYATDYEFINIDSEEAAGFVDFMAGADLVISDAQYTYLESVAREGWGHSTSFNAIDLAVRAEVRRFYLFHHDPNHSDAKLYDNLNKTKAYHMMISERGNMIIELAVEGMTVAL